MNPDLAARERSSRTGVRADKIDLLYRQSLPAVFIAPAMAGLLCWGLWDTADREVLLAWLALLVACMVPRLIVFLDYFRARPTGEDVLRWEFPYAATLILTTVVWGAGGAAVVPDDDAVGQIFTFFVMIGVAGGAILAYSAFRYMAMWSAFAVLLPSIVRSAFLAQSGTEIALVLGAATFLAAAVLATGTISTALERSFTLTHELALAYRIVDEREQHFRFIAEKSGDVIWAFCPAAQRITYVSPAVRDLLGFDPDYLVDRPIEAVMLRESLRRLRRRLHSMRASHESSFKVHLDLVHRDGTLVHAAAVGTAGTRASGQAASVVVVTHDVSEMQRFVDGARQLAYFDSLTELPNRRLMLDRLEQAIARARRDGSRVGVLCIDLDGFKPINDRYGHYAGDFVLREVAARLKASIRESDTAARIGGDEFVVLLTISAPGDCQVAGEKIRAAIAEPCIGPDGTVFHVSSSVGAAIFPDHATDQWELLKTADAAMYRAKRAGGNASLLHG